MATLVGAPNLLRGQSQSGGPRALDAIRAGVASCLCSDYAPSSLLAAALRLPALSDLDLPAAVALVTTAPAAIAGLGDRGLLAVGKRADCIAVRESPDYPRLLATWVAGRQMLAISNDW
jgi:alpha-D-ribose 1-methylphosphonate 5-triphosphate diphosphatase